LMFSYIGQKEIYYCKLILLQDDMWTAKLLKSLNAGNGPQKQAKEWQKVFIKGFLISY